MSAAWSTARCAESAGVLYDWATTRDWASPFVADAAERLARSIEYAMNAIAYTAIAEYTERMEISSSVTVLPYVEDFSSSLVEEHRRRVSRPVPEGSRYACGWAARYSTTGASTWANAQPTLGPTKHGTVALGHNGNLTNTESLLALVEERLGHERRESMHGGGCTDTAIVTALLGWDRYETLTETAIELLPHIEGAFSLVFMDETALYAARDPQGVRPLVLGRIPSGGWVVASETPALDIVGAVFEREVEPGEFLTIDADGVHSQRFAEAVPKGCVFEYVYLARPDTSINGRSVHAARVEMGRALAREHPVEADMVMPTPESGTPAAVGYAQQSGIPFGQGLTKNAYVGRTFIQPSQTLRQLGIRLKLNPLREQIAGKRLVVVDDSIVRGNTQRAIVQMLRDAGAAEVHVRISSPPVQWPCFYGIDFATREELAAVGHSVEDIRDQLGADSLGYISLEGMITATEQAQDRLCTACFTGEYPIEPPLNARHLLATQPVEVPQ